LLIEFNPQEEIIAQDCETVVMARQRRVAKKINEKEAEALMVVAARETVRTLINMPKAFISLTVMQMMRETTPSRPNDIRAEAFHEHDLLQEDPVLCRSMTDPLESTPIPAHKLNRSEIQVIIWRWIGFLQSLMEMRLLERCYG
jgi:hypothetical protein